MADGHSANMPRTGPQSFFIKHILLCLASIAKHPTIGGWGVKTDLHKVSLIIDTHVSPDALRHWWPPAQSHPHLTHLSSEGGYGTMAGQETPAAICYRKTSAEGTAIQVGCWMLPGNMVRDRRKAGACF